jgi:hypothetical protein
MAKASKTTTTSAKVSNGKKKRPGVHSKKKNSKLKSSKNYTKKYVGQG